MTSPQHAAATPGRMPVIGRIGWLPGTLGAGLGVALAGLAGLAVLGSGPGQIWLVASMGASAVLVFVLPASPLAQPRAVLGGNLLATLAGLAAHVLAGSVPLLAATLAVTLAIALMNLTRTLHPPAGGTALVAALAAPTVAQHALPMLIAPLVLNLLVLLGCGLVWHRLTGHSYPHRAHFVPVAADWIGHVTDEDLDAVLEEWDEVLSVSRNDLLALIHAVEGRVRARNLSPAVAAPPPAPQPRSTSAG